MGEWLNVNQGVHMTDRLNAEHAPVLLFEHPTQSGHLLAEARLNSEPTLNALSLEMIDILTTALSGWAGREEVVAVVLSGAGERAFSAGGDIQALYRAMVRNHEQGERVDEYPYQFFEREYRLDYALHTCKKPLIALGHGVMMGGGLGVFMGAHFRIVPEKSRIAMPEVSVGLFPDAGGTWMLRNLPQHLALFLGLTGASINSADALACGIATHGVPAAQTAQLLDVLQQASWQASAQADHELIRQCLAQLPSLELPAQQIDAIPDAIHGEGGLLAVVERIRALRDRNEWISRAVDSMERGCPTTLGIVVEQLSRAASMSLADCFRLEMTIATHCADNHDFAEGVRALLIDKDNSPRWQFGDVESLPAAYVTSHFEEPWARNPLADLEEKRT
jgi:enoyl-CoA hydratase/carnithine racemase